MEGSGFIQPRVVLLVLVICSGVQRRSHASDVETLPDELLSNVSDLQDYFCEGCNGSWGPRSCKPSDDRRCPFCQQICQPVGRGEDTVDAECYQESCGDYKSGCEYVQCEAANLCENEECDICHFTDAHVTTCEFDNDDDICVFDSFESNKTFCVCEGIPGIVVGKSCSDHRREMLTTQTPTRVVTQVSTLSTLQPPSARVNTQALVIGSIAAIGLVTVFLIVICFCPKSKLMCKRRQNTPSDRRRGRDNAKALEPQSIAPLYASNLGQSVASENLNPTYGISLGPLREIESQKMTHGNGEGGTPAQRRGKADSDGPQVIMPSAPPVEMAGTEANGSPKYFVLEPEQPQSGEHCPDTEYQHRSGQVQGPQHGHSYFTLEPPFGNQDDEALGSKSQGTKSDLGDSETEAYDHIDRSHGAHAHESSESLNYAHLDPQPNYDHFSRPGQTQTKNGAVSDNMYSHLDTHS